MSPAQPVMPCPECGGKGKLPDLYGRGWAEGDPPMLLRRAGACEDCLGTGKVLKPSEKVKTGTLGSEREGEL